MSTQQWAPAESDLSTERQRLLEHLVRRRRAAVAAGSTVAEAADATAAPVPGGEPARRALAISLFFFSADLDDDPAEKYDTLLECAELADTLGLHAIWVPERHFDRFGGPYPAPTLLLAAIAARTRRIGLRAGSVVLPLHDPVLVAEEWGVLDAMSRGRSALSLASGWHANDFVLDPDAYHRRKEVLVERLSVLRALWRGEATVRPGPDGQPVEVRVHPRVGRMPDIWLTSTGSPATWRTAGELNLNVLTALLEQSVDDVAAKVAVYREALAAAGHPAEQRQVTCMLHTHLAEDPDQVPDRVRPPLTRYLSAHLDLFAKFAATRDIGVRPENVTEAGRKVLLEHGLQRYLNNAGLFGSVETCRPMVERLIAAGVTELGCLVDFGLPRDQLLESVHQLAELQRLERERVEG